MVICGADVNQPEAGGAGRQRDVWARAGGGGPGRSPGPCWPPTPRCRRRRPPARRLGSARWRSRPAPAACRRRCRSVVRGRPSCQSPPAWYSATTRVDAGRVGRQHRHVGRGRRRASRSRPTLADRRRRPVGRSPSSRPRRPCGRYSAWVPVPAGPPAASSELAGDQHQLLALGDAVGPDQARRVTGRRDAGELGREGGHAVGGLAARRRCRASGRLKAASKSAHDAVGVEHRDDGAVRRQQRAVGGRRR